MKKFQLANNVLGCIVFAIAAAVYLMTIEPTASFWDCGEFITSAYKLEVGHPPGAPLFMLIGNIFSHLTDAANAAKMVNSMSALFSALTILFLFWTITHLTRKLLVKDKENMTLSQTILILGCGLVGSLAYTFSDTFWFSAVEGEVYASSSLFTAVVFWLILKWEDYADAPHADRWIILIAYLMGLSIGVHLLNLLCIPAIVLVYYYKRFPNPTLKGTIYALIISFAMIAIMMYGVVQGLVEVCGWFELLFVNTLKMPYNSGVFAYVITIAGVLIWAIWETMRQDVNTKRMKIAFILSVTLLGIPFIGDGYFLGIVLIAALTIFMFWYKKINIKALNTILISLMVIVIGYSTFALILVRATADTPMNQNNPRDIFTLRTYLAREQYGDTPLLYGRTYVSELERENKGGYSVPVMKKGTPAWSRIIKNNPDEKDRYEITSYNERPVFIKETCMLFPRMHSSTDQNHIAAYKEWGEVTGTPVKVNVGNETKTVMKPTFTENLRFFFNYQLNFMYWRYFMWNFSGRQNDMQGYGNIMHGNWITGIKFIDELRVGPQDNMLYDIAHNKGHNVFYMLPLLLGIIGILYQVLKKGEQGIQSFWITFFLFFMTGIAIVLYLNQSPYQPRERDYAYAGSFYAFCIWIGIGVAGIAKLLEKAKLPPVAASAIATLVCLFIPLQMASQTWDDHDRSGRYVARDFGRNYLESCEPDAIIFTHGDNDTFPLWYVQEVEGVRTDVRVCNTSYLQTDWYINQMKRQAYNSNPLPISWEYKDYVQGKRDMIYLFSQTDQPISLGAALNFAKSDDPKHQMAYGSNMLDYLPSTNLVLKIDSANIVKKHTVNPEYEPYIVDQIDINLGDRNAISKVDAITLDILNTNNWERPIYYAITVPGNIYSYVGDYMQKTGLASQIVPLKTKGTNLEINTKKMYDNVMNKFKWGGVDKPGTYLEETTMRMCKSQRSVIFADLANALMNEGKRDSAIQVLDKCVEVFPEENVPYDFSAYSIATLYFALGETEKAKEVASSIIDKSMGNVDWMLRLKPSQRETVMPLLNDNLALLRNLLNVSYQYDKEFAQAYMEQYNSYFNQYQSGQKRQ
ncbi:MAG: DUF2723 domain-containing protein [Tannerella sp.]|jgi:tetratricopeptide (TPR) repeat protein|nr:DUF2723 domain-containing protein [Tannerella sp.]